MTALDQVELWVKGESVHNHDREECCPDFSCCSPEINTPIEKRIMFRDAYVQGNDELVEFLLMEFLNNMLASESIHHG